VAAAEGMATIAEQINSQFVIGIGTYSYPTRSCLNIVLGKCLGDNFYHSGIASDDEDFRFKVSIKSIEGYALFLV
jgi:hypothetical protein